MPRTEHPLTRFCDGKVVVRGGRMTTLEEGAPRAPDARPMLWMSETRPDRGMNRFAPYPRMFIEVK